eukprot:scaffold73760_cov34-Tisochrysis_lutea.AAC.1
MVGCVMCAALGVPREGSRGHLDGRGPSLRAQERRGAYHVWIGRRGRVGGGSGRRRGARRAP